MKSNYSPSLVVSMSLIFTACGGGGSVSTNNTNSLTKSVLKGTVPGTLIEAFCEDGSYHSVKSKNNGTGKHPFELNLSTNLSCRLVMTTNEHDLLEKVVTPISFTSQFGPSSIAFKTMNDIDLGFVDLALNRSEMMKDSNQDGVEDIPKDIVLNKTQSKNVEIQIVEHDPLDSDNDDIIDIFEDYDNDKISNYDDDDDDGDGILDSEDHDHENYSGSDDELDHEEEESDDDTDPSVPTIPGALSAGRLLASQCAQCHGTDGVSTTDIDSFAGETEAEIIEEMIEMRDDDDNELMHLQARGYTNEQIRLIAEYFVGIKGGSEDKGEDDD